MHPRNDKGPNFFVIGIALAVLVALIAISCNQSAILSSLSSS